MTKSAHVGQHVGQVGLMLLLGNIKVCMKADIHEYIYICMHVYTCECMYIASMLKSLYTYLTYFTEGIWLLHFKNK